MGLYNFPKYFKIFFLYKEVCSNLNIKKSIRKKINQPKYLSEEIKRLKGELVKI